MLIPKDLILYGVCNFLSDKDAISLIQMNKKHYELINKLKFKHIYKLQTVPPERFHQITNVLIDGIDVNFIHLSALMPSITHLKFGYYCSEPLMKQLPESITHLEFGPKFNSSVACHLPPNLTHLTFGCNFNRPVDQLPESVTHLEFGSCFNQPVDHLPSNLIRLTFGCMFNQCIGFLPPKLMYLELGRRFNQSVCDLPKSLVEIKLPFCCDHPSIQHIITNSFVTMKPILNFTEEYSDDDDD